MEHPQKFLLQKIIGFRENGLTSLGELPAKQIDDLVKVIHEFAEKTVIDFTRKINEGFEVEVGGNYYYIKNNNVEKYPANPLK